MDNFTPALLEYRRMGRGITEAIPFSTLFKVIHNIWDKAHPDIEIVHAGEEYLGTKFPCIAMGVFNEVPAKGYPKPRLIESIPGTTGSANDLLQWLQIFELIIRVDMYSTRESGGAETAELICETFKKFMQEYCPVFEAKGIGDIRFFKRFTDEPIVKLGETIAVKRSIAYLTSLQTVTWTTEEHLKTVEIEARTAEDSTEDIEISIP